MQWCCYYYAKFYVSENNDYFEVKHLSRYCNAQLRQNVRYIFFFGGSDTNKSFNDCHNIREKAWQVGHKKQTEKAKNYGQWWYLILSRVFFLWLFLFLLLFVGAVVVFWQFWNPWLFLLHKNVITEKAFNLNTHIYTYRYMNT